MKPKIGLSTVAGALGFASLMTPKNVIIHLSGETCLWITTWVCIIGLSIFAGFILH